MDIPVLSKLFEPYQLKKIPSGYAIYEKEYWYLGHRYQSLVRSGTKEQCLTILQSSGVKWEEVKGEQL